MHLSVTPTKQLSAPNAKTISVALGRNETTRILPLTLHAGTAMGAVTPAWAQATLATGASLFECRPAIRASDKFGLHRAPTFRASRPDSAPNEFFHFLPQLLYGWEAEAEGEPAASRPCPFGTGRAKDLPKAHLLALLANTSPATLADTDRLFFPMLVATHGHHLPLQF
jgi:hypothetical protein